MSRLQESAPGKVNLTLRVLARRDDGLHDLASVVAFAATGDELALDAEGELALVVNGPTAAASGRNAENLVLKAARAARERIEGLRLGRFTLTKRLPTGAGLGGGSADAAAALRLIARANDLAASDPRLFDAARATGADVPVCLEPRARLMHGSGDLLSAPLGLPSLDAVLVFPGFGLSTGKVFRAFTAASNPRRVPYSASEIPRERPALLEFLAREANDLEAAAISIAPAIADAKASLQRTGEPRLVRMSGAGSAIYAIYDDAEQAADAVARLAEQDPDWWVAATTLA